MMRRVRRGAKANRSTGNGEQTPTSRGTLERVFAAIGGFDSRAHDDIDDSSRDEYLAWFRQPRDLPGDLDRQAAGVFTPGVDLSDVHAGAHPQSELRDRVANRPGALDR